MTKKRRKRVLVAAALFSAAVGLFAYLALRENPDYVRAAKRLPEARMRAQAMFGPLTWEEYRAQNGIDPDVDLDLWQKVADSVPAAVKGYLKDPRASTTTRQRLFQHERLWFENAEILVADLRWRHLEPHEPPGFGSTRLQHSKSIVQALCVGLVGAADSGDVEAILKLGRAVNRVIEQLLVEPADWPVLVARANRSILSQALLRAAVRNRHDQAVLDSVRLVLEEQPAMPTVRKLMAADLRLTRTFIVLLRPLSPRRVDEQLNAELWGLKEEDLKYSLIDRATDIFDQIMGGVSAEERPWENRRTGRHTVDALDARFLETVVEIAGLMEAVENNDRSARALLEGLSRPLDEKFDWSYEIASTAFAGTTWIDAHLRSEFHDRATLAMFELLDRFPDHEGLPDELPPDLQFPDPFGGEPAHYVKTATGFLIYTIGSAYDDTRYTPSHPDLLGSEARFTTGLVHGQWAYILSYDPIIPVP